MRLLQALGFSLALAACGGFSYVVPSSQLAPGADATIEAKPDASTNQTLFKAVVSNLAPPARISADATVYVAWYRKNATAGWIRMGNLAYEESARGGQIIATVPEAAFDFILTAEATADNASPSLKTVFEQRVGE